MGAAARQPVSHTHNALQDPSHQFRHTIWEDGASDPKPNRIDSNSRCPKGKRDLGNASIQSVREHVNPQATILLPPSLSRLTSLS